MPKHLSKKKTMAVPRSVPLQERLATIGTVRRAGVDKNEFHRQYGEFLKTYVTSNNKPYSKQSQNVEKCRLKKYFLDFCADDSLEDALASPSKAPFWSEVVENYNSNANDKLTTGKLEFRLEIWKKCFNAVYNREPVMTKRPRSQSLKHSWTAVERASNDGGVEAFLKEMESLTEPYQQEALKRYVAVKREYMVQQMVKRNMSGYNTTKTTTLPYYNEIAMALNKSSPKLLVQAQNEELLHQLKRAISREFERDSDCLELLNVFDEWLKDEQMNNIKDFFEKSTSMFE